MEDGALQKFRRSEMGKKLKTKDIFGYTIGSIGDCASYNFVLSFFSFFMTTVAGVSPAVAVQLFRLQLYGMRLQIQS